MSLKLRYLNLKTMIRDIRMLAIIGIAEAGSGHPGASFSAAEIMGSLYFRIMKHDPHNPQWPERDYFVNSKAHSAPGYYATLSLAGYFPSDEMGSLRKLGSRLQGTSGSVQHIPKKPKRARDRVFWGFGRDRAFSGRWNCASQQTRW